jgi:hypothetical protein
VDTGVLPISTSSTFTIAPGGFEEIVSRRCTQPGSNRTINTKQVITGDDNLDTEISSTCVYWAKYSVNHSRSGIA